LCDGLAVLAILVSGQVEATTDEVDVCGVDADILRLRDGAAEEMLDPGQLVKLSLETDVVDPGLALDLLVESHKTVSPAYR
jgi:hypothetical protein